MCCVYIVLPNVGFYMFCAGGLMVRIGRCQRLDPGSIPGRRTIFLSFLSFLSFFVDLCVYLCVVMYLSMCVHVFTCVSMFLLLSDMVGSV